MDGTWQHRVKDFTVINPEVWRKGHDFNSVVYFKIKNTDPVYETDYYITYCMDYIDFIADFKEDSY